jgi:hypothetical protein
MVPLDLRAQNAPQMGIKNCFALQSAFLKSQCKALSYIKSRIVADKYIGLRSLQTFPLQNRKMLENESCFAMEQKKTEK